MSGLGRELRYQIREYSQFVREGWPVVVALLILGSPFLVMWAAIVYFIILLEN